MLVDTSKINTGYVNKGIEKELPNALVYFYLQGKFRNAHGMLN
jgi:hypothetical protein